MVNRRSKAHVFAVTFLALILIPAGVLAASKIVRKLAANTINPVASVSGNGRHLQVNGPVRCSEGQTVDLRVTVTQRTTGAVAEGRAMLPCTGDTQTWEIDAQTQGNESFQEGPATATALATTSEHGQTDDAHQWLVNIKLVNE